MVDSKPVKVYHPQTEYDGALPRGREDSLLHNSIVPRSCQNPSSSIDKESSKTELESKYKHILDADALLGTVNGHGVARMLMDYNKTFDQREILDGQIF
ncbi:uncharacterized protein PG998_012067 [Apiospora kogelbergensis]|uniref:uncharacterized protein n=1 Tax=Apiospora kogelbergensis TaxID=1337665 RepID=UPI00312DA1F9